MERLNTWARKKLSTLIPKEFSRWIRRKFVKEMSGEEDESAYQHWGRSLTILKGELCKGVCLSAALST